MPRGIAPTHLRPLDEDECPACLAEFADDVDRALSSRPPRDRRWRAQRRRHLGAHAAVERRQVVRAHRRDYYLGRWSFTFMERQ